MPRGQALERQQFDAKERGVSLNFVREQAKCEFKDDDENEEG
jgi:hypothetical protein